MTLDATVGGVSSNSYVTMDEADLYFTSRLHSSSWDDFLEKESALITATNLIDWYVTFKGVKTDEAQALEWPRTGVLTRTGASIADDIIPKDLKIAVYEMALASISADRTVDDAMAGLEQIKAGSLMIKSRAGGTYSTAADVIPEHIWKALSDLTTRSGIGVVRLMRA